MKEETDINHPQKEDRQGMTLLHGMATMAGLALISALGGGYSQVYERSVKIP
jgi:hypothetical protein